MLGLQEVQFVPLIAAAVAGVLLLFLACDVKLGKHAWMVPAVLGVVFALISVRAVVLEGPLGFWPEHTRNLWGNQIWIDLLLAATIAMWLSASQARALGMRVPIWIVLVLATGSIGLCGYAARLMYLRSHGGQEGSARRT